MYNESSNISRGCRNNNPFNIKRTSDSWKGQVPQSETQEKTFCVFYNVSFGIRAGIILLKNYIGMGYDTVDKIISRYAPPNENFTKNYISYVRSFVSEGDVPFDGIIPFHGVNSPEFYHLCYAICKFESEFTLSQSRWREIFMQFPELNKPIF